MCSTIAVQKGRWANATTRVLRAYAVFLVARPDLGSVIVGLHTTAKNRISNLLARQCLRPTPAPPSLASTWTPLSPPSVVS